MVLNLLKMKNLFLSVLCIFLAFSCGKEDIVPTKSEVPETATTTNVNSTESEDNIIDAYDIIVDHFSNNRNAVPSSVLPEVGRDEFVAKILEVCENFKTGLEVSAVLTKLVSEYGMSVELQEQINLFHNGLLDQLNADAYDVEEYYLTELDKKRGLNHADSYLIYQMIRVSQGAWQIIMTDLGIQSRLGIVSRNDRDPLCQDLIDDLNIKLIHIGAGASAGGYLGGQIGGAIAGPLGAGVGSVIGFVGGAILGWFSGDATLDRKYARCEECLPPTSILRDVADCSLTADFTPIGAGSNVTQLTWSSNQTVPPSATGARDETQTFTHIAGSGPITFRIDAECVFEGDDIVLSRDLPGGNIEGLTLSVPSNAFYLTGDDMVFIYTGGGPVGGPVTVTYQYNGLALDNSGDYTFQQIGGVQNGTIVSTTSSSITIRWYPTNLQEFEETQTAQGRVRYRVTNTCPGGESKIVSFGVLITGDDAV